MPLGIFGGSSKDSGPKLQPLTSTEEKPQSKKEKGVSGISNNISSDSKDLKGTTVKLNKKTYTIERKLAEGGFAIVYLVNDKHSRNYALKRQLVRDDPRQVEACRTEIQIVKNLNGHKNIVAYVDHQLSVNKVGIYDYMLLTVYYPANVLQLMNSRLLLNKWLSMREILNIFCDMCEAVARLHHSKTPVIHRDLKVENVLIDQRSVQRQKCSRKSISRMEEIQRYTTLSYRAPEMIDLYSGIPIDTKSDMWALGILLADSIINLLLTLNALHRPNIYQASHLAFFAADRKCPVYNIERSLRIELSEAVQILKMRNKLGSDYARLYEKAFNDFEAQRRRHTAPSVGRGASDSCEERHRRDEVGRASTGEGLVPKSTELPTFADRPDDSADGSFSTISMSAEGVIVNTTSFQYAETHRRATTTSVNPRLRPKPQTTIANTTPMSQRKSSNGGGEIPLTSQQPIPAPANRTTLRVAAVETDSTMCDFLQKSDALEQRESLPPRLNSAFRPYTLTYDQRESNVSVDANKLNLALQTMMSASTTDRHMDDNTFGECFDKMRRSCVIDQQLYTDCKDADGCPSSYDKETWQLSSQAEPRIGEEPVGDSSRPPPSNMGLDCLDMEQMIGDDPFGNAPPLLPHQIYLI
uniref:non-specific serine/threonine protein kinase n=1 Tax=Globodera rostochiensis TaxID=31243 RepID=A0A914GTJ7_GLORO